MKRKTFKFYLTFIIFLALNSFIFSKNASAYSLLEISFMGAYSKTKFSGNSYSRTKRYSASLGLNLTATTEIELAYMYANTYLNNNPYQTQSTNEQTLSLSLVQTIVPPTWYLQPYLKAGAAQYNRKQEGSVQGIPSPTSQRKSPSAVAGFGVRALITRFFSIKGEAQWILPDFHVGEAKNNFSAQGGISFQF